MAYYTVWMASTIIIYECHTKAGSHLRIKPTQDEIINSGYKWDSMYANVREFVMKCQICEISVGKVRKGNIQNHIKSVRPLQWFQIDLVQLSNIVATKNYKFLFTMVDHFSKYGWARWIIDKKSSTLIKALKSWLATHNKPEMIQSDNGPEFTSRDFKHFRAKRNINQIFAMPYNPKSQGAEKNFNKTIQRFLESAVYHQKRVLILKTQ